MNHERLIRISAQARGATSRISLSGRDFIACERQFDESGPNASAAHILRTKGERLTPCSFAPLI